MTVVVDPYLISLPHAVTDAQSLREYAMRVLDWDEAFRTKTGDYVVSSGAMSALYKLGLDPSVNNLENLFTRWQIDEVSAVDIATGCERIITNYPQLEDRVGLDAGILCKTGTENVIPESIRRRLHPDIAKEFICSLVATSYAILTVWEDQSSWRLATAPLENGGEATKMIVAGEVSDHNSAYPVTMHWQLLIDPRAVQAQEAIVEVFESNPVRATQLAWDKVRREKPLATMRGLKCYSYVFGEKFLRSLKKLRARSSYEQDIERVFEAVVYVLEDLWSFGGDEHHALRESIIQRTSKQRTRNRTIDGAIRKDRAGRARVTKEWAIGLHLHYWQLEEGGYEFSNITDDHDDSTIYG